MDKNSFIIALRSKLSGLPAEDIDKTVEYYSELIADRMEDGLSEEDAVSDLGSIDDIAKKIIEETPITKLVKSNIKPKKSVSPLIIILIILGIPVWVPIVLSAAVTVLSLYISVWVVAVSLFAVVFALAGASVGGIVSAVLLMAKGSIVAGIALLGACLVLIGLFILLFILCKYGVKLIVWLTKTCILSIKKLIIRKVN